MLIQCIFLAKLHRIEYTQDKFNELNMPPGMCDNPICFEPTLN